METRTVGVEEELLVIDPATRSVTGRARQLLRENAEHLSTIGPRRASDELDQELFRHQLEIRTDPVRDVDDLVGQVLDGRRTAGEAAAAHDLAVAVSGTVPLALEEPVVSDNDRYRDMAEVFGQVARRGTTCGMHVHVAIESPEEGVRCIDRIAPWLPVLLATSSNSPFHEGRLTGYASWRTELWSTWPSAGPTEEFGSLAGYRRACERMIASGAARDASPRCTGCDSCRSARHRADGTASRARARPDRDSRARRSWRSDSWLLLGGRDGRRDTALECNARSVIGEHAPAVGRSPGSARA